MKNILKKNRMRLNQELGIQQRQYFSPALYGLNRAITPAINQYAKGKLLDIGCGDMPYKDLISQRVDQYEALDFKERAAGVNYIGSVEKMDMIQDGTYDSAVCFEVLEHVPNPFEGVKEINRILKKDGILILSVPHLSRLHEQPHDYFRYTSYGITSLMNSGNFNILELKTTGGFFSFLGHQTSTAVVGLFWGVPVLKWVLFFLNKWLCVFPCYFLDRLFFKNSLLPLGHVCVVRKK
jgi:SAM-dependent methyltransferase